MSVDCQGGGFNTASIAYAKNGNMIVEKSLQEQGSPGSHPSHQHFIQPLLLPLLRPSTQSTEPTYDSGQYDDLNLHYRDGLLHPEASIEE